MLKKLTVCSLILLLTLSVAGSASAKQTYTYSNLADQKTQKYVAARMVKAGICPVSCAEFLRDVNDYNKAVN